jgi:AcrR family transcriptional regulator
MSRDRKITLTKEMIVDQAMELADTIGSDALTMRKLADAIGTAPMTIYYYLSSKDLLIDEMVERVFSEIEIPPMDQEWKPALRSRCQSARRVLNRHFWAAPLMESRSSPGLANMRHHDAVIGCLRRGGFPIALAAHAYAVLDSYIYGFAFEETTIPEANRDGFTSAVETIARHIDATEYPYLIEMAREHVLKPGYTFGASFDFGLDLILDGLEQALVDRGSRQATV